LYTATIHKIKELDQERPPEIAEPTGHHAFMIIWNNLNISFWVGKQCKTFKDHFDNDTTMTLIYITLNLAGFLLISNHPMTIDNQWWTLIMKIYF